jgi:PilZ domain-containing protein
LCGQVRYRQSGTEVWMDGELKNISKSGVLFAGSSPISEGTWVEIELEMPSEIVGGSTARRVKCAAEITRAENGEHGTLFGAQILGYEFVQDALS